MMKMTSYSKVLGHGGRTDGRNRCLSIWKGLSTDANASEEAQTKEQLWKEYFADPSQWWDNRIAKINPRSPDFKHKVTRKALWVDGWSTPLWAKSVFQGEIQPHVGHCTQGSEDTAHSNRLPKSNKGRGNSRPNYTRESRQNLQVDDASTRLQSASILSEAIAVLKNHVQQGITVDSYIYVEVLQRCFKLKDLVSAKHVHDCITESGMEQNTYVANNILRVYIRCGRLQEARQVFDRLVQKSVISWTIMIGGYAQHDHAEDAFELYNRMRQEGAQPNEVTYLSILKACANPVVLKWGKKVHAHIRHGGFQSDVRVGTALLKMYAKCGSITEARQVFDNLTNRDVIAWTVMIGAYAESGRGHKAHELFLQMQQEGYIPDAFIYTSMLNQRSSVGALEWLKDVHAQAVKAGLELDVRVANGLINMYAKCGCVDNARQVFDRMVNRDVISWNVIIGAYAESGCGAEAYQLFLRMEREGVIPDAFTYTSILNPRASVGALEWLKEVHTKARNVGLDMSVHVGTALVGMYAASGTMDDARLVFDNMVSRNVTSWNVMIGAYAEHVCGAQAYQLFLQMQQEGFTPDEFTYLSILKPCGDVGALEWVRKVHAQALQAGLESDLRVGNALVHIYAKSGSIEDARVVFDRLVERDVITWNVMIGGYAGIGHGHEAYALFLQMQRGGFVPTATTYLSILNACASTGALEWVKEVHSHACNGGLESDLRVGNALIHMYAKSGSIDDARVVFDRLVERDVITWTAMIGGYAGIGRGHEAYELFLQMQRGGLVPNATTYVSILNPCASAGSLEWVKEVHNHALEAGLDLNLRVGTALVHMYAKCGSIDDARLVFDRMGERDVITWNVMIGALAQHGFGHEALQVYNQMKAEGVKPSELSFVAVLSACSNAGLVDEGRHQFLAMTEECGIRPSVVHYSCMVDILGRAGHLEEAKLLIHSMPIEPDGATWGAFLGACRIHGNVELAESAAKELLKLEPEDASAYVLLSNIYATAGKWDQVSILRNLMQERGIRKEPGCSWIEVDNKIHPFVVGDTSHPEAKEIYAEQKKLFDKMRAEGYRPDTRLVLHDIDEEDKELAVCSHSEKLAITYGLMRVPPGEVVRIFKNLRVCSDCHTATKFISKMTGREILARDANRFHHFKDGVCSCGDYW